VPRGKGGGGKEKSAEARRYWGEKRLPDWGEGGDEGKVARKKDKGVQYILGGEPEQRLREIG